MTDAPTKIVAIPRVTDPAKVRVVLVQPDTFQSVPLSGAGIPTLGGDNVFTGNISVADDKTLHLLSDKDLTLTSTDHPFQVGQTASINIRIDGNQIQALNNGLGSTLNLNTETDGGNIQLGNAAGNVSLPGGWLQFPATQIASADPNTIDDYEEGLFTPVVVGSTGAGVGTYTTQNGRYTKVGNRVSIEANMVWTAHTGTGNIRWGGAPFTSTNVASAAACYFENITYGAGTPAVRMFSASTGGDFVLQAGGAAIASIAMDTSGSLIINVSYQVA